MGNENFGLVEALANLAASHLSAAWRDAHARRVEAFQVAISSVGREAFWSLMKSGRVPHAQTLCQREAAAYEAALDDLFERYNADRVWIRATADDWRIAQLGQRVWLNELNFVGGDFDLYPDTKRALTILPHDEYVMRETGSGARLVSKLRFYSCSAVPGAAVSVAEWCQPPIAELGGLSIVDAMARFTAPKMTDVVDPDYCGGRVEWVDGGWKLFDSGRLDRPVSPGDAPQVIRVLGLGSDPGPFQQDIEWAARHNSFTEAMRPLFLALRSGALVADGVLPTGHARAGDRIQLDPDVWSERWLLVRNGQSAELQTFQLGKARVEFRRLRVELAPADMRRADVLHRPKRATEIEPCSLPADMEFAERSNARADARNLATPGGTVANTESIAEGELQRESKLSNEKSGMAGRPTSRHLLEAEMKRRAAVGMLCLSLEKEAAILSEWLAREHKDAPKATPKTIMNSLRGLYRGLLEKQQARPETSLPKLSTAP